MARNRKRAKDRRARRPQGASVSRPGLATTRVDSDERENAAPEPLEHATPDAELAEAQLALGRPELEPEPGGADESESVDEFELEAEDAAESRRGASGAGDDNSAEFGGELEEAEVPVPAARQHIGSRLINFLQGSWRELQRVQWPDRRQVMQATGVVIGFVVVAGVFLGLADFLAGKLVNLILK